MILILTASLLSGEELLSPCKLITRQDVENLFKETFSDGVIRESVTPAGKSCRYTYRENENVYGVTLRVSTTEAIEGEGIFDSAKDVFDRQVRTRKAHEEASKSFREIENPGDGAFWEGTSLWVLNEDVLLIVKVNSALKGSFKNMEALDAAQEEQDLALSLKVAETVLARLQ